MKKLLIALFLVVIAAILFFFFFAGSMVDKSMNVCLHPDAEHYNVSTEALSFHEDLIVADLHSDVLLWDRDITKRGNHGHTDVPRLREGNFTLQVFDAVIKTPRGQNYESNTGDSDNITMLAMANRWPGKTWKSLYERAIYQSEKLYAISDKDPDFRIVTSSTEMESLVNDRAQNQKILGGVLSIEGLHALEGDINKLDKLYEAGYRMMGPVHFFDNDIGGSSAGIDQYGLTDLGKEVIKRMDELSITIDLAHASPKLIDDILDLTERPVIVSHTGIKGVIDSPRNLTDNQIFRITKNGGLIGIGFWDGAVGSPDLKSITKSMRYVKYLVGADYIALGSDWDGGTTTYFDAAHISALTEAMMEAGFSKEEIRKIMGENVINFFKRNLPRT